MKIWSMVSLPDGACSARAPEPPDSPTNGYTEEEAGGRRCRSCRDKQEEEGHTRTTARPERYCTIFPCTAMRLR